MKSLFDVFHVSSGQNDQMRELMPNECAEEKPVDETTPESTANDVKSETAEICKPQSESDAQSGTKEERSVIAISKIGSDHTFANKNNQDFAFNILNMKVVMDGCGSGKHSEVGVRLFAQLFVRKVKEYVDRGETVGEENFIDVVHSVFEEMLSICHDSTFLFQNYCFTILICFELEDQFVVCTCGDGYIIKQKKDSSDIEFAKLDDGEYPCYYIYNYIEDKDKLLEYKEGAPFKVSHFSKEEYSNVGVASDGLRFFENLPDFREKQKFIAFLKEGKGAQIEKLINRNNRNSNGMFHDDISICF